MKIVIRLATLMEVVTLAGALVACAQDTPAIKPMAKDADPSFEVAVIKPSDPNDPSQGFSLDGHRIHVENNSMAAILCFAYSIQGSQIANAPEWFDEQRWDIDGVPDVEGEPSWDQYRSMLRKLLAARFGLVMHHDKRELSVYTLTVTKGGPKLEKSKSDPEALSDASGHGVASGQYMKFTNETMSGFAHVVQMMGLDKPVIDETNLAGRYDFSLTWNPNSLGATATDDVPGLFTAVQEQLGLKLEATRAPADVLVIDAATKPTQN